MVKLRRLVNKKKKNILKAVVFSLMVMTSIESQRKSRRWWVRPWIERRTKKGNLHLVHEEFHNDDPEQFKKFLRMDQLSFNKLLDLVSPLIRKEDTVMREAISARDKLTITLRFLATGESYRSLMYSFRVSESAISLFVPQVCDAIYITLKDQYLKAPETAADWLNIAKGFEKSWNCPKTIGALDGKHIVFNAPKSAGSVYYNYKNTHSIVLLALVDADYNFRYIDVGCNGRVSDGGVFLNSSLCKALFHAENILNLPEDKPLPGRNQSMPHVIVADGAFPLSERILKPYPFRNMTNEQRVFNYRLSRARRVVENAFGILANRFRVLLNKINLSPHKVEKITLAACVLHNFLRRESPNFSKQFEEIDEQYIFQYALAQQSGNRSNSTRQMREEFTAYFNAEGAVPWQNNLDLMF